MAPNLIMHTKCMAVDGRLFLLGLVSERSCSCYMWHPVVCVLSLYVQVTGCCLCVVTVCTGDRLLSVCCHALYVQVTGCCLCIVTLCTGDRLLSVCCHCTYN